jgi:hypothetical protein
MSNFATLLNDRIHDQFSIMTFEVSCFKTIEDIDNKPLRGLDGNIVSSDMILIRDGANYYIASSYIHPHFTYKIVLETLEDKLTDKTRSDVLVDIVEASGRTNKNSIRVFDLVWESDTSSSDADEYQPFRELYPEYEANGDLYYKLNDNYLYKKNGKNWKNVGIYTINRYGVDIQLFE